MAESAAGELPAVSIVVAVEHAEPALGDCLQSIVRTDYPADRREIVLVVGESGTGSDGAAARSASAPYPGHVSGARGARAPGQIAARVVADPTGRVTVARNRGVEASGGTLVVFTDPDCVVSRGWLREIVEPFGDRRVAAVAGAIVPFPGGSAVERYAAARRSHSQERVVHRPQHPFALSPNLAVRRDILLRVGGFDSRFPGGGWEDADLCWRIADAAHGTLRFAPRAIVFHRYRTTTRAFFSQHVRYGYGLGLLREKYPDRIEWRGSDRRRVWRELAAAGWRTAAAWPRERRSPEAETARFDFLRLLAHRIGFTRAALGLGLAGAELRSSQRASARRQHVLAQREERR